MTAHRPITLAQPADAPAFQRRSISLAAGNGPKEQGRRLRVALLWATQRFPEWAAACRGLNFDLVTPSFAPARLEQNFVDGGCALVRIEMGMLRFIRVTSGGKHILEQQLPARLPI